MVSQHPKQPGRPRGSGAVTTVAGHELTSDEAIPYLAGWRLGQTQPHVIRTWQFSLEEISPYLRPAERAHLAAGDAVTWARWVSIGMLAAELESYVRQMKGA